MATPLHGTRAHLVHEAEDEAREAQALVEALEERVRDGDDKVTPEELENATKLSRFARLRVEAAEKKARTARKADAGEQVEKSAEAVKAFLESASSLEPHEQQIAGFVRDLAGFVEQQRVEGMQVGRAAEAAAAVAAEFDVPDAWAPSRPVRVRGDGRSLIMVASGERVEWRAEKANITASVRRILAAAGLRVSGSFTVVTEGVDAASTGDA